MYRPYSSPLTGTGSSTDVESTIRGLGQDFSMNFNTGNYDQVAGLFASDGLFMAPHHEAIAGPKAIERKLREFGENGFQDLRLETLRVDSSGDMAMEIGRYKVSIVQESGGVANDRGKYVKVWRRWARGASWPTAGAAASAALHQSQEKPLPATDKVTLISNDVPKSA